MHCVKCRRVTETDYITTATSKNGRLMRRGQCITCGITKTPFVKRETACESFLNTPVNKLPFQINLPGHNFAGPGTKLDNRLNSKPVKVLSASELQNAIS